MIRQLMAQSPVLVFFLILGVGLLLGRIRVAGVQLGSVTGVLLVGLLVGHLGYEIPSASHSVGFIMFIYCIGYQAGPQFLGAFKQDGAKYFLLSVLTAVSAAMTAVLLASGFDLGISAGMLAGALTSTPTLVAAQDAAAQGLELPPGITSDDVLANISSAYAITYVFGLAGLILFITVMPRVLRIDVAAAARALGGERGASPPSGAAEMPVVRAYRIENPEVESWTREGEDRPRRSDDDWRLPAEIQRIKRGDEILDLDEVDRLALGDVVTVVGLESAHEGAHEVLGPEVVDRDVLDRTMQSARVIVTKRDQQGRAIGELDFVRRHQVWLTQILRGGIALPRRPELRIRRGDVMLFTGAREKLERVTELLGYAQERSYQTDLVTFGFGIAIGVMLGIPTLTLGTTKIGLGTAGGVLLSGLATGWLTSSRPHFGQLPDGARYVLTELGLLFFMAGVAVTAGETIVETFRSLGPELVLFGAVITLVPVLVCFAVGRFVLRMNLALLLGAITGSMTSTAALQQVSEQARSSVPMLGYVGTYAFANVFLALAGGVIMRL